MKTFKQFVEGIRDRYKVFKIDKSMPKRYKFQNRKWPGALQRKVSIAAEDYAFISYDFDNYELELWHSESGAIGLSGIMKDIDTVLKRLGFEQNLNVDLNKWMLHVTHSDMAIYMKKSSHDILRVKVDPGIPRRHVGTKRANIDNALHPADGSSKEIQNLLYNGIVKIYYNKATDIQGPIQIV